MNINMTFVTIIRMATIGRDWRVDLASFSHIAHELRNWDQLSTNSAIKCSLHA